MPDRWGTQGPPEDAYSRVSRDLAEVTAGFADYLDPLPENLVVEYECAVREATRPEKNETGGGASRRRSTSATCSLIWQANDLVQVGGYPRVPTAVRRSHGRPSA